MTQPQEQQQNPPLPNEVQLPASAEKILTINIDDIKPNTILCITVKVANPIEKMQMAPMLSKLFSPFASKLREKGVTVMIMSQNESIDLITEEEMNAAGWEKKAKTLIINPFGR